MLSIAIKEENSHFEHGLKIIISHLANQWHQEICFLPVEDIDRADIAFISLDEDWLSADCYQIPVHTRRQHRVVICNRNDKDKLMFRPCLYMLPLIYREDDNYLPLLHHSQLFYRRTSVLNVSRQRLYLSRNGSPALGKRNSGQSHPSQHYEKAACEKRSAILKIHPGASELSTKLGGIFLPDFLLRKISSPIKYRHLLYLASGCQNNPGLLFPG